MGLRQSWAVQYDNRKLANANNDPNPPQFQLSKDYQSISTDVSEIIAMFLNKTNAIFSHSPLRKISSDLPTNNIIIDNSIVLDERNGKFDHSVPYSPSILIKQNSSDTLLHDDSPIETIVGSLKKDIRQVYKFQKILGNGHFATVRMVYRRNDLPRRYYAIKSISKENITQSSLEDLIKEVDILSQLDHPNIIRFYETYHDDSFFHIVMELCKGKEVFDRIVEDGKIQEKKVARVILKVLHTISYCHSRGVTHRDLKPENILFQSEDTDSEIKLIDFGLSRKYSVDEKMHTILGTPYYIAPEVLQGEYDEKCDIWSIGALCYVMLSGDPPFKGTSNNDIFRSIIQNELKFMSKKWKDISKEAISFIQLCMQKKGDKRPNASEAIQHLWFKDIVKEIHSESKLDINILNNLKNFTVPNKLKKMILKYIINVMMTAKEIKKYKAAFYAMDYNHNGSVTFSEFKQAFNIAKVEISDDKLKKIIQSCDEVKKGSLDYSEFIMACLDLRLVTKEKLEIVFNYFDVNNSGLIETADLSDSLLRYGKRVLNEKDIDKIITEATPSGSASISLNDFLRIFNIYK